MKDFFLHRIFEKSMFFRISKFYLKWIRKHPKRSSEPFKSRNTQFSRLLRPQKKSQFFHLKETTTRVHKMLRASNLKTQRMNYKNKKRPSAHISKLLISQGLNGKSETIDFHENRTVGNRENKNTRRSDFARGYLRSASSIFFQTFPSCFICPIEQAGQGAYAVRISLFRYDSDKIAFLAIF